jgi:Putative Flp pilus-assembly TadE/G-like
MKLYEAQRGQTLPLVAVAMLVLLGTTGFAVDVGYHQYRQRIQQTATDSAAIAAGQELLAGNFVAAGKRDAASNGFTDGSVGGSCVSTATCVRIINPPEAPDAFSGQSTAVEALITSPNPTFFENVFGISSVPITTKAVAILVTVPSNQCVVTLDPSHTANFNGGALTAPDCGLMFNGGANFNNATVNAASILCAATCSNGTFAGASPKTSAPVSDPCPTISQCAYLANNPPSCNSQPSIPTGNSPVLQPGCYTSSNMKNLSNTDSVTFTCGLYVLQTTMDISATGNHAPITVNQSCSPPGGVTFYIDTGGQVSMRNVNMALNAPTSGDYSQYTTGEQKVLFYQKPGNTNTANFQSASCAGCTSTINGMMYFPSANLNYNAGSSTQGGGGVLIISGQANFNGNFSSLLGGPGEGNTTTKVAVLGE